jgi:hypothetical protein
MATFRLKMPSGSPSDSSPLGSSTRPLSRFRQRGSKSLHLHRPPHRRREPSRFPHQHRHLHPQPRCFRHRSSRFRAPMDRPPRMRLPRSRLPPRRCKRQPRLPRRPLPSGLHSLRRHQARARAPGPPQEPSTLARSSALLPRRRATRHHPAAPRDLRPMLTPSPSRRRRSAPRQAPRVRVPFPRSSSQIRLNPRRPAMSSRPRDRHFRWTRVRTSPATSMKMPSRSSVRARLASSSACSSRSQVE